MSGAAIPDGWGETTLGRVLQRSPSYGINAAALPRGVGKFPYLRITDIDEAGRVDIGSLPSVRDSASDVFILSDGDIVVARTGASVGKSHLFKDAGEQVVFAGFLIRLSADKDAILPDYLAQFMQTAQYWDWIRENSARSGQPGVNGQQLKTIPLVLPPLHEQQAIAAALSDADGVVAGLERVIAKKRLIKQGAMQDLLTARRRLPGFSGEWEVKRLGDLVKVARGASPRPIESSIWFDENSSVGWVRISDLSKSDIFLKSTTQRLSQEGIKRSRRVEIGSLIMSIAATLGRPAITQIDVCIHDGFVVLSDLKIDKFFLFHLLKSLEPTWALQGQTGSQMNLNTGIIEGANVRVPPSDTEQKAIAEVFNTMDAEIQTLDSRLTKARAVKEGMMQNLLTGRVRLV